MPVRWTNSATRYGLGGRCLHWLSVALLVTMIVTALPFEEMEAGPEKTELIRRHASYGLIFLLVMGLRVYWRLTNANPVLSYSIRSVLIYPLFAVHITAAIYHQIFGVLDD